MRDRRHLVLPPAVICRIARVERTPTEAEHQRMEDDHVALRCQQDHGRVVSVRGQRSTVSEEPEVRRNVFSFPARESDHLNEVTVIDPAGIESGGDDLELRGRALRIPGAHDVSNRMPIGR